MLRMFVACKIEQRTNLVCRDAFLLATLQNLNRIHILASAKRLTGLGQVFLATLFDRLPRDPLGQKPFQLLQPVFPWNAFPCLPHQFKGLSVAKVATGLNRLVHKLAIFMFPDLPINLCVQLNQGRFRGHGSHRFLNRTRHLLKAVKAGRRVSLSLKPGNQFPPPDLFQSGTRIAKQKLQFRVGGIHMFCFLQDIQGLFVVPRAQFTARGLQQRLHLCPLFRFFCFLGQKVDQHHPL